MDNIAERVEVYMNNLQNREDIQTCRGVCKEC